MSELEILQGTWQAIWLEEDGRKKSAEEVKRTRVLIRGDHYTVLRKGPCLQGTIARIEPSGKVWAVDFQRREGPDDPNKRLLGICLLEDDELTVCTAPPGHERPRDLDARAGSGCSLHLLRRVSAEPPADDPNPGDDPESILLVPSWAR